MKNRKVVVFGGSGFLGSYVVDALMRRGHEVKVADIQSSPFIPENQFISCDILNAEQVANAIDNETDVVYNLAGLANLDDAVANPVKAIELNVMGNLNVLEAARQKNVKQYVYASSAYAVNKLGSFYGISKLSSEKLIEEYNTKYGLNFTILRYGSVYSERAFENNYIFRVIQEAIQNGKIVHKGDGEEVREYIHAADAAKLSVDVIEDDQFLNEHIILTGVERFKRKELFGMIQEILNNGVEVELSASGYENHYKTTPYSFNPTLSKKLVANPFIDMGQGILRCIEEINQKESE